MAKPWCPDRPSIDLDEFVSRVQGFHLEPLQTDQGTFRADEFQTYLGDVLLGTARLGRAVVQTWKPPAQSVTIAVRTSRAPAGAWASTTLTDNLTGSSVTGSLSGWLGGGQVGFNYQMGSFVWGVEGTFDWSSLNSTTGGIITAAGPVLQVAANTKWVSTLAARFGFAADRALFYGKAGGGWVGNNATITNLATGSLASSSNTNSGWVLGAGVEYAFTPNWTVKVEYDYLGLRGWTATSPVDVVDTVNVKRQLNIVMAGINYKFGW